MFVEGIFVYYYSIASRFPPGRVEARGVVRVVGRICFYGCRCGFCCFLWCLFNVVVVVVVVVAVVAAVVFFVASGGTV